MKRLGRAETGVEFSALASNLVFRLSAAFGGERFVFIACGCGCCDAGGGGRAKGFGGPVAPAESGFGFAFDEEPWEGEGGGRTIDDLFECEDAPPTEMAVLVGVLVDA